MAGTKIIFIGHSAGRSGAPLLLLEFLEWLRKNSDLNYELILKVGGPLVDQYQAIAKTTVLGLGRAGVLRALKELPAAGPLLRRLFRQLTRPRPRGDIGLLYVNSVASLDVLSRIDLPHVPVLTHVLELEKMIRTDVEPALLELMKARTVHYFACSRAVKRNLAENHGVKDSEITVIPTYVDVKAIAARQSIPKSALRARLKIADDAFAVVGCGWISQRKGTDLFIDVAQAVVQARGSKKFRFVWIGNHRPEETAFVAELESRVRRLGLTEVVTFAGEIPSADACFGAFDAFALTSREEPMGLVGIEAAVAGVPTVCFDGAGGFPEFVDGGCGYAVPYLDTAAMAQAILALSDDNRFRSRLGMAASRRAVEEYDVDRVAPVMLEYIRRFSNAAPPGLPGGSSSTFAGRLV